MVDRFHANEGSAANILQLAVIQQMGLKTKVNKSTKSLTGFNGRTTVTVGTIDLDVYSPLVISSQTFMADHGSARSTPSPPATHQKIHYPIPRGDIGQINSDQAMTRKCLAQGLKKGKQTWFLPMNHTDLKGVEQAEEKIDPIPNDPADQKGK
ncbi:unnamed protein product [Prunus armeniaca]